MRKIRKQETEKGSFERKLFNKAMKLEEIAMDKLESVGNNIRGACGNCQGCVGNDNYYEYAYKFGNFSIEKNSCYTQSLVQSDFGEYIVPQSVVYYLTEDKIGITEKCNTEEVAEILLTAEKQLDKAITDRQEKRKKLEEKL